MDPFLDIPTPRIKWVDPIRLVRHEHTSRAHLESLLAYLQTIPPNSPIPVPVVTASHPQVILDGHHRVSASRILGLKLIPVWEVDDLDEIDNWDKTLVRCYAQSNGLRMALHEVTRRAREGNIDWGIKGTRHVAHFPLSRPQASGEMFIEVALERVTPRVNWGSWISSNDVSSRMNDIAVPNIGSREHVRVPGIKV
ncbi:hypothetical protein BDEG_21579 [Batrachochytrium dendrobatidis JEL423]|uniref:ParB/Sulfiredoxin domain-containing protein n=1 Tax=Batrachochytrium dendrobatidis (strain JEL423) TaxID=403673 RepID=A0A177WCU7_BATDL|nr:hypothetical protein BDEG_21579 [Batrachochytrium dendrobatidis JEL423]